jgi:hypothetical protein
MARPRLRMLVNAARVWRGPRSHEPEIRDTRDPMTDILFVLVTIAFFIVAVIYARACDRL